MMCVGELWAVFQGLQVTFPENIVACQNNRVVRRLIDHQCDVAVHSGPLTSDELAALRRAFPFAKEFSQKEVCT